MDVGFTTIFYERENLINSFSKYIITVTPMSNLKTTRTAISDKPMFESRTIVQTNISTIDMVEFAKSQTALYVGLQMQSGCDVVFDVKKK